MKKMILATVLIWLMIVIGTFAVGYFSAHAEIYPQTFVVVECDHNCDVLTLRDFNGFEWFWFGAEDYKVGDLISAIMEDNNTTKIFDDEIIVIHYSSYVEGWE